MKSQEPNGTNCFPSGESERSSTSFSWFGPQLSCKQEKSVSVRLGVARKDLPSVGIGTCAEVFSRCCHCVGHLHGGWNSAKDEFTQNKDSKQKIKRCRVKSSQVTIRISTASQICQAIERVTSKRKRKSVSQVDNKGIASKPREVKSIEIIKA